MAMQRFGMLRDLVDAADRGGLVDGSPLLSGYSGAKLVGLLQRLAARGVAHDDCYAEVGVFQGMTLLSVASAAPGIAAYGIDNFSQFDVDNVNKSIVKQRMREHNIVNAHLIDQDFEDALENFGQLAAGKKISTYFVDGPHDYRSQLLCLELAKPHLADDAVIVIDDSNYQHVRQASVDFLKLNPAYKLFFQHYSDAHPANLDETAVAAAREGWWNGVTVIVRDPDDLLASVYPPTDRDRTLFVNDHIVQSARLAQFSPRAMRVAAALFFFRPIELVKQWAQLAREYRRATKRATPDFDVLNTYSQDLQYNRFNPALPEE
jgi:hypothetical protein